MHIIDALNYGGAQKLLVELAAHIPRQICRTVVCALQPPNDLADALRSLSVDVVCLQRPRPSIIHGGSFISYSVGHARDVFRLCKTAQATVVHCHLSDAEFLGIPIGRAARVPRVVTTVHYPDLLPLRSRTSVRNVLRKILTRVIYYFVDTIIAVSDDVACRVQELVPGCSGKIRVIINGINTAAYAALPPPAFHQEIVLTTIARLMPPKGHQYLIDAVHRLRSSGKQVRLLLAGDGDLYDELVAQTRMRGIYDNVVFLGNCADIAGLLATTDIFVLPSLWEGTSLALLEAMAAARPIVATDIPGIRRVLESGRSGILVRPADAAALAQAITVFIDNPQYARTCGEVARRVARERFDIKRTIAELLEVWGVPQQ
ncbi:MAG: glycosyltransferase [Desulfobacterota bacterium]|nr:glycosyltransferase [Thermodesulfobacteriota bacterium]